MRTSLHREFGSRITDAMRKDCVDIYYRSKFISQLALRLLSSCDVVTVGMR